MKVETDSGVSITILPEGSSKIMVFDKPVRIIELKKEEASQIRVLLTSSLEIEPDVKRQSRHSHPTKVTKAISR